MKSVCGWATPSGPPSTPPPATRIGSHGQALRYSSVFGSRHLPWVAYPDQPTATADPCDAPVVDVDVVRVVGQPVVAAEVDRVGEHDRARRVAEIRDPDRPAVAATARREGAQAGLVRAACRASGPDVVALVDAADRVARGQVDEVANLLEVLRIRVRDDVEAGAAAGVPGLRAERADARAAHLVDVVVTRVEGADDQVAADVDVHVLVLPVAVRTEDLGRLERVEHARVGRVADVERLEAEAAGDDQHVPPLRPVELPFDDLRRAGHARHVLERVRHLRTRRRRLHHAGGGSRVQHHSQGNGERESEPEHHDLPVSTARVLRTQPQRAAVENCAAEGTE